MSLFGSAAGTSSSSSSQAQGDISKDVEVKQPPEDSVSCISFSSQSEHLAVSSWDKKVRIYEIDSNGNSSGKALFEHEGPVLSCCWSNVSLPALRSSIHPHVQSTNENGRANRAHPQDGTKVFGAGADKAARMLDVQTGTPSQVAAHDAPIRCVSATTHQNSPLLVTGSWDKTVKFWDLRTPNPVGTLSCQDRVYTMDVRDKLLVIGTAERWINVVNMNEPSKFYKTGQSPLKWQTRVVSCFTDATGYAVGSIEGRCAINYVEERDASNNFSFKCHRQTPGKESHANVYSVNDISFHPVHGTFTTAGSDGSFHFWDKDAKHRLKGFPEVGQSITSTTFNRTGAIFAYACSYDWSKGFASHTPNSINKIMMHPIQGDETKPRSQNKSRR